MGTGGRLVCVLAVFLTLIFFLLCLRDTDFTEAGVAGVSCIVSTESTAAILRLLVSSPRRSNGNEVGAKLAIAGSRNGTGD